METIQKNLSSNGYTVVKSVEQLKATILIGNYQFHIQVISGL